MHSPHTPSLIPSPHPLLLPIDIRGSTQLHFVFSLSCSTRCSLISTSIIIRSNTRCSGLGNGLKRYCAARLSVLPSSYLLSAALISSFLSFLSFLILLPYFPHRSFLLSFVLTLSLPIVIFYLRIIILISHTCRTTPRADNETECASQIFTQTPSDVNQYLSVDTKELFNISLAAQQNMKLGDSLIHSLTD